MNAGIAIEREMKRVLDGTFTRISADGSLKTDRVKRDFMPTYAGMFPPGHVLSDEPPPYRAKVELRTPFTANDDRRIIAMLRAGASYRRIADAIGRQQGSVDQRVRLLKREGRL